MSALTLHEADLLHFIDRYAQEEWGACPTYDEMRQHLGLKSRSGIHNIVTSLERKGRITRTPHASRSIEVVPPPPPKKGLEAYPSEMLVAELARRAEVNHAERING